MNKPKILTIDDSADMLFLEKIILERNGFEVFTANSGLTALEMIPNISDLSLILVDVQMERMDGLQFIKELASKHSQVFKDTPTVLVTGMDDAPKANVAGYIKKVSDLAEFVSQVKSFIPKPRLS